MSKHKKISLVKSAIRLAGYLVLTFVPIALVSWAAWILIVSEILGVLEEVEEK